jgi:processive 1,2-diacylglycerol beta-glucosyltransferase
MAEFAPPLYGMLYALGNVFTWPFVSLVARAIRRNLAAELAEVDPDVIVVVHPWFLGSALSVLERTGSTTPVVAVVADLDNVSYLWADSRAALTLCPTKEPLATMRRRGVPDGRLAVTGFPVREAFSSREVGAIRPVLPNDRPVRFLLMSGSQGGLRAGAMASVLLRHFDCHVTVMAGRGRRLRQTLEVRLIPRWGERVRIIGFVEDVGCLMQEADILLLRASPNALMEAVTLCRPVIVIGAFAGQEAKNPALVERERIGVRCTSLRQLPATVSDLLADGGAKLREMRESQLRYRKPDAASRIATAILSVTNGEDARGRGQSVSNAIER